MRLTRWFLAPTFASLLLAGYAGARSHNATFVLPVRADRTQPAHHGPLRPSGARHHTKHGRASIPSSSALYGARSIAHRPYEHGPGGVALVPPNMRPRPPPAIDGFAA